VRRLPLVIVWAACFGSPGRAEPIDWRQISADAKWSAHIDFDAAKAAKTAKQVYEDWLSHGPAQQGLRKIREVAGIDLIEDLRSLTFYGTRFVPQSGVVLVRAKVDRQRLLRFLERDSSHRVDSYRSHKLHTWQHAGPDGDRQTVTGCFHQPELVVIGRNRDEVEAALDVLDGRSSSLAAADGVPDKRAPAGTIFEARARATGWQSSSANNRAKYSCMRNLPRRTHRLPANFETSFKAPARWPNCSRTPIQTRRRSSRPCR
jgi:hypothetical protein